MNSKKIILITGGTRGLGYQIALECLDLGYKIIVTSTKNKTKNDILIDFIVKDTGIGIPIEKQELIRFYGSEKINIVLNQVTVLPYTIYNHK